MNKLFNNYEIESITNQLKVISKKSDIKTRWKLALKSELFLQRNELRIAQLNMLIEEEGANNDEGIKTLSFSDPKYQEFMNCETEIDFSGFQLEELSSATMEELLILKDVIIDGN